MESLSNGETQKISFQASPDFLDIQEKDLVFNAPVDIQGEVYLASQSLLLHLNAKTTAFMPCSVCNNPAPFPLVLENFYFTEEIENLPSPFDFSEILREALLMELPFFVECNQGNCPERATAKKYLKEQQQEMYFPFSDLK